MNIFQFQSHPLVEDCLVFGIKEPSVQELISAVVVVKEGATLNEGDIKNFVNNRYVGVELRYPCFKPQDLIDIKRN